ncbi:MAG: hypothetical protein LAT57_06765 [Balneolales bacterium]|nr:hypothetical protein [Balneolales bacterium]
MRTSNILLLTGCTVLLLIYSLANFKVLPETNKNTINAILGDKSYISTFGEAPNSSVTDAERTYTHLSYVEQLLRNSLPDNLTPSQKEQRLTFLDHLRDYRLAGNFPVNDDHPDTRRPTFISGNGNICAVGYLVEQSAGRAVAEFVNDHYKYSYINAIDAPIFLDWAEKSGFTIEELAMIQPAYQSVENVNQTSYRLEAPYIVTSSVALTANAFYWSPDFDVYSPFTNNTTRQWAGLAIGTGTILHGILNVNLKSQRQETYQNGLWTTTTNYVERNYLRSALSSGQIIVGAATLFVSARNLLNASSESRLSESGLIVTSFSLPHENGAQAVGGVGYRFAFN